MKKLLAVIFCTLLGGPAFGWVHGSVDVSPSIGSVSLNLASPAYYSGFFPILNVWQTGSEMALVSSTNGTLVGQAIWDNGTYFEPATGDLKTPVPADVVSITRGFFTPVLWSQYQYEGTSFNNFANQQWDVTWQGCAAPTVSVTGTLGSGGSSSFGLNSGTVTLGSSGYSNVGLRFTLTAGCYADPPRNIKVFQHQYATQVAAGEVWNPDWIDTIKPFGILRLMDWMQTNFSGISDVSQLADFNFNSLTNSLLMPFALSADISGTTLTVNSLGFSSGTFAVGQKLIMSGLTVDSTIVSLGSGSGGTGTYTISCVGGCPTITNHTLFTLPLAGSNGALGPKAGVSPSVACSLARKTGAIIHYPIPIGATDQMVADVATAFKSCMPQNIKVKYELSNEIWNTGFSQYYYYRVFADNVDPDWMGYRAAQVMDIIYNVYGSSERARWIGSAGSQYANPSVTTSIITGVNTAISTLGLHSLTQLFDEIDIAPYWGFFLPDTPFKAASIQGVTAGANPTVTSNGHTFVNGQTVTMFVSGGTMASVLDSNASPGTNVYATVSNVTATTYDININTTGLTYGGSANYATDANLPKMADQSTALNGLTPGTYPTKFSFFAQQMSKAILNGSVSDASYGTLTVPASVYMNNTTNSIQDLFRRQALEANQWGLSVSQYEGGPGNAFGGILQNPVPQQVMEFINQSNFDAGAVGDSVNTPANVYATAFQAFRDVWSAYPSQYNDLQPQTQYGPWGALRFIGDQANPRWQAILAENSLAPYVDPIPVPTWSFNYNSSTDKNFDINNGTTLSCTYTASGNGLAVFAATWASSSTLSSVTLDGSPMTQNSLSQPVSGWSALIASLPVTAGAHTISFTLGSGSTYRSCYAMTLTGLHSNTPVGTMTGNPAKNSTMNVQKGSFMLAVAAANGALTFPANSSLSGTVSGNITQIDNSGSQVSGFAYWSPGPSFNSSIFKIGTNAANALAGAAFR